VPKSLESFTDKELERCLRRIAVSVRDEESGIEASQAVTLAGEVQGAGS
jgi:hypothetical protein